MIHATTRCVEGGSDGIINLEFQVSDWRNVQVMCSSISENDGMRFKIAGNEQKRTGFQFHRRKLRASSTKVKSIRGARMLGIPIRISDNAAREGPKRCTMAGHWRVNDLRRKGKCVCAGRRIPFNTAWNIPTRALSPWQPLDRAVKLRLCDKENVEEENMCILSDDDDEFKGESQDKYDAKNEPYDYTEDDRQQVCLCCKKRAFIFNNDHIYDRPVNQRVHHKYFPPTYLEGSNYAGCTSNYNVKLCDEHINARSQTCGCFCGCCL